MELEEIKTEIDMLVEQYLNNDLAPANKKNLEHAEKIIKDVAEKRQVDLDRALMESPGKVEELLDDYLYQVTKKDPLGDVGLELKELIILFAVILVVCSAHHLSLKALEILAELLKGL